MTQEELVDLRSYIQEHALPFTDRFRIQQWEYPDGEEGSFFLQLPKADAQSDLEAFGLLLLRLEFLEQELNWTKTEVEQAGTRILTTALSYMIDNGTCSPVEWKELLGRSSELTKGHLDIENEITGESRNLVLYDDWNLLQWFGMNSNDYYMYLSLARGKRNLILADQNPTLNASVACFLAVTTTDDYN